MEQKEFRPRMGMLLLIPLIIALAIVYAAAARTAHSFQPIAVYQHLMENESLLSLLVIPVVVVFLVFRFAKKRISGMTINAAGIQVSRFGEDSQWLDWAQIHDHSIGAWQLELTSRTGEVISVPLWLFSGAQRRAIIASARQYLKAS